MKILLATVLLLAIASAYQTEESGVLVLHDSDFPDIISEYNYILIEFYAPWCGHCKRLEPEYNKAAQALKEKGSNIKLAKVDTTKDSTAAQEYGVRGYPTIMFFVNKTKVDFSGQRNADGIINWCEKKVQPPTTGLETEEELNALKGADQVSLVLYSDDQDTITQFEGLAVSDDDNRYYVAKGALLEKQPAGTVEIHRSFGESLTHAGLEDTFAAWLKKYSRPFVVNFDDRTIGEVFHKKRTAVVLFNTDRSTKLKEVATQAASQFEGDVVFTEILPQNEHFNRFAEFIHVGVDVPRIVGIKSDSDKKALFEGSVADVTVEALNEFADGLSKGEVKLYGYDETVSQESEEAATEQATPQPAPQADVVTEEAGDEL